jgi:hypothetical protein
MRTLSPIVCAQALLVPSRQSDFRLGRAISTQFVGHQLIGREALFLRKLAHQFYGHSLVAPSLHQQVEDLASTCHSQNCRPAIITTISSRCHRDVGRGRRRRSSRAIIGPNFNTHRRTVSYETAIPTLGEQILDVAITERETHIMGWTIPTPQWENTGRTGSGAMTITTIGLDTSKTWFQVHCVDADGGTVLGRKLARGKVLSFFANIPSCLVGLEGLRRISFLGA